MKNSTKAALLSCFVFPGVGHLYLKRFMFGIFLLVGAAATVYIVVSSAMDTAHEIVEKIQSGRTSLDVEAIAKLVEEQSRANGESTTVASMVFLALWLTGILDSVRIGRRLEKGEGTRDEKAS